MIDEIRFHGLERVEERLLKHAATLDYVALDEVVSRKKRMPVARVAFTVSDLTHYFQQEDDEDPFDAEDDEDTDDLPTDEVGSLTDDVTEPARPSALAHAARTDDDDDDEDEDEGDETPDDEEATLRRDLCRAVIFWIRSQTCELLYNRPSASFRLQLYRPKGGYIGSKNFKVENLSYRPAQPPQPASSTAPASAPPQTPPTHPAPIAPAPPPPPPAPAAQPQLPTVFQPLPPVVVQAPPVQVVMPTPEPPRTTPAVAIALTANGQGQLIYLDPDTIPEARVWRALGRATEEFLGTVGKTYGGIIELQARTVHHQAEQLDKSQHLVEHLAGQLLVARQVKESDEAEQKVDERQLRVREELGKTFLSELGSLGRVLASSKLGMAPELIELGDIVSASPELAEAVRDPNVRAMLKDEKTTRELAQLLRLASRKSNDEGGGAPPKAN